MLMGSGQADGMASTCVTHFRGPIGAGIDLGLEGAFLASRFGNSLVPLHCSIIHFLLFLSCPFLLSAAFGV